MNTGVMKWECPLCGQVVTVIKDGHPRLPSDFADQCKLREHMIGDECIAFRQEEKARELLANKTTG